MSNFNRADILRTAQIFHDGDVFELRIPKAGKYGTISGYFDKSSTFIDSTVGLSDEGFPGYYFTLNPVRPDLLARSANVYTKYAKETTADSDIIRRLWLPIDLDPVRPAGISSNDAEHGAALEMAQQIRRWLIEDQGWPAGAFVLADSGNGGHLCPKIDLPNDDAARDLVKHCLEALDFIFSTDAVKVDTSTFNAARIWKIYGTMARKGSNTGDRPHRLAKIIDAPEGLETVSREQLEALAAILPKVEPIKSSGQTFDPVRYAEEHGANVLRTKAWNGGTLAVLEVCPFDTSHDRGEAFLGVQANGARYFRCKHDSCKNRDWYALKALWGSAREETEKKKPMEPKKTDGFDKLIQSIDLEELTEGGNAARLERLFGDGMRFNHTLKKWLLWDGGRWRLDTNGGAMRRAANVAAALYLLAGKADGKDERKAIVDFARETDTRKGQTNMLALAATRQTFALTADDFDRDAWLLAAGDVTFDLKTCTTREPRREDLITKAIGAKYDRAAQCPTWIKFQNTTFGGDKELIAYVKRAVGYCLTGSMIEQIFFFCYGMGANGKSVFLAILRALLGEYAKQADFSTFLVQRNEKVRNDLAALAGARVITAIEAEEGGRLSMQIIKSWTGADPITARFLFGEYFTFQPTGKIWLAANNKPAISERNHAAWRRVRLIPFNATIPEAEQDKQLESKLLQELPGILNWALEGLQDYLKNGLDAPKVVLDATNEYRRENDSLEQFVFECCEMGKLNVCKNTDLFSQYQNFCGMSGLKALSQTKFSIELKTREGISPTRNLHGITWLGIDLKKDWKSLCRVEDNPTSQAVATKHVGLEQNAQPTQKSPTRGDFAQNGINPTPDNDSNPTCLHNEAFSVDKEGGIGPHPRKAERTPTDKKSKEGFQSWKAGMKKRKCILCGRSFPYDLTYHANGDKSGYECTTCMMHGPPTEPAKPDPQLRLVEA